MRTWIYKDSEEKFIPTDELDRYLLAGWYKGRTPSHRPPIKKKTLPEKTFRMRSRSGTVHEIQESLYRMKSERLKKSGWKFVRQPRTEAFKKMLSERMSDSAWISSSLGRKRVHKSSLQKYVSLGWVEGMKYTDSGDTVPEFTVSDIKTQDMISKLSFLRNDIDENQGLHYHQLN